MSYRTRLFLSILLTAMFVQVAPVFAGAIKNWTTGETLTSNDLNANFQHIHNAMVGGHGGRLINSDVSAIAAISNSKLESNGKGIARSWTTVADECVASPCTMVNPFNVSSITWSSTGVYVVTLPYSVAGSTVIVTANSGALGPLQEVCNVTYTVGTTFNVQCFDMAGAAKNAGFSVVVFSIS